MEFEWDEAKNISNVAKHGIEFEQAASVFAHPCLSMTVADDRFSERRVMTIGRYEDTYLSILTVIHTQRGQKVRIISARPASRKERFLYEQTLR